MTAHSPGECLAFFDTMFSVTALCAGSDQNHLDVSGKGQDGHIRSVRRENLMEHAESLQGLLDKSAIADVIHAYCLHFDRAEAEAVVALFTDDAVVDYGPDVPTMEGRDEFRPMIVKGLADLFAATSHHISNIMIKFDGTDRATSVCYLYAWHRYQDREGDGELWGQYHHEFTRTPDGWKIANLVLRAAGTDGFHRQTMHPTRRRQKG